MSNRPSSAGHRTGSLYGSFAFGSIILSCFAGFFFNQHYYGSEWAVLATFGLGALYATLGVLGGGTIECKGPAAHAAYYLTQCALLTAMVWISPVRGFFGILVLPVIAQAIFDLRPWNAVLLGVYLFGLTVSVWAIPYGWSGLVEALVNYSTAFAFTIVFTIITKRAVDSRNREEKLREEVEAANRQLREFAAQAGDLATTKERNRVAREIHDGVGHYLTVVKTQLDAATALLPAQPDKAREAVVKAARLTGEALDDVRRSVGALRTDAARPPLPQAIKDLAAHGDPVPSVAVEGAPRPLSPAVEHALFRAAQEGLTNIRKHARASSALVVIDFRAPIPGAAGIVRQRRRHRRGRQPAGRLRAHGPARADRAPRRPRRVRQPRRRRLRPPDRGACVNAIRGNFDFSIVQCSWFIDFGPESLCELKIER